MNSLEYLALLNGMWKEVKIIRRVVFFVDMVVVVVQNLLRRRWSTLISFQLFDFLGSIKLFCQSLNPLFVDIALYSSYKCFQRHDHCTQTTNLSEQQQVPFLNKDDASFACWLLLWYRCHRFCLCCPRVFEVIIIFFFFRLFQYWWSCIISSRRRACTTDNPQRTHKNTLINRKPSQSFNLTDLHWSVHLQRTSMKRKQKDTS